MDIDIEKIKVNWTSPCFNDSSNFFGSNRYRSKPEISIGIEEIMTKMDTVWDDFTYSEGLRDAKLLDVQCEKLSKMKFQEN